MSVLKNLYKCSFCKIDYEVLPFSILRIVDKLIALTGMRLYQCPHCFGCTRLPWAPWLNSKAKNSAAANAVLDRDSDSDCGPVVQSLMRLEMKETSAEMVPETV